jgi:hypothetical protein
METERHDSPADVSPPTPARFRWRRFLVWIPACLAYGGLIGWVSVSIERYRAPLLLFPLLMGLVLGATLVGMSRVCQVGNRFTVLLGVVLAALAAVIGQHYVGYRDARRQAQEDAQSYRLARLAFGDVVLGETPVPPAGFLDFLRWRAARGFHVVGYQARGAVVWVIWVADALLAVAAAVTVVLPALNKPYCDRCRSWFRTIRRGPLDPATAGKLAGLVDEDLPDEVASTRYRIFACNGGCGPTGLELRWVGPGGESCSTRAWLGAERRNGVVRALDERVSDRS